MNNYKSTLLLSAFILSMINGCVSENDTTTVRINTSKTGEPIEEYIYGQFIEHLGKCIYGGIWAEMLEDRKFYYPITDEFNPWATDKDDFWNTGEYTYLNGSPWEVIGPENTVEMDTRQPFCGDQAVRVNVPGGNEKAGIRQSRLEVLANRKLTAYVFVKGEKNVLPIHVQLKTPEGATVTHEINDIGDSYDRYSFELTPDFACKNVALEIFSTGSGSFTLGTVSLMPEDNIKGWRPDVIALLKELNAPVYRWPGGNFVSGYNWMDGIGERDMRPPRKNPAWKGVESNDVGIHEYMELMKIIDAEAFIAVNTGLGTIEEVANEIAYCNGSGDTEMGQLRAENGHPEPYGVRWWAVGNEMYGSWQLGHMPLEEYVKKHNNMAEAIWDVDPDAKLIAVGAVGEWSKTMLSECADHMDLLSEHIYCREIEDVQDHIGQLANSIKSVADAHRKYKETIPGLADKNIRIALDEWNYWYGDYIYGELGVRYHQKDALGVAMGLHEYFRNSDIFFMANYAQTVNVIGCIKTTPTTAGFAATGLPLKLYRNHFGSIPVYVDNDNPALDIAISLTENREHITIAVVNSTDQAQLIDLEFKELKLASKGKKWLIQHPDPEMYNVPDEEPTIAIEEFDFKLKAKPLAIPAYSISMYSLEILSE
ncbi:alpha-L-arabinofuranosidase C-terminal domain-containing protein [Bacteroidota bacterium]